MISSKSVTIYPETRISRRSYLSSWFLIAIIATLAAIPYANSAPALRCQGSANSADSNPLHNATSSADDSSITSTVVAPMFARLAKSELLQLKQNVTLGDWCKTHPDDSLVFFRYTLEEPSNQEWCVQAEKRVILSPSRQIAIRRAYFYAPLPPSGLALRQLKDSVSVRTDEPILGMIWIEMIERSVQASATIADSLSAGLSTWLGSAKIDPEMFYYGSSGWGRRNRWQKGETIFASARGVTSRYSELPMVIAFGFLPISNVHIDDLRDYFSLGGTPSNPDSIIFQRTLHSLGQNTQRAGNLIATYYHARTEPPDSLDARRTLDDFREWITLSASSDHQTRAAALLLADQVLNAIIQTLDAATIPQFRRLGATITESRTMGWIYERSWLKQALALDSNGTVGDLALMIMIQRGFQLKADCHDCGQCFGNVIQQGERFLLRTKDPWFRRMTHLALAYAYSDVVALANDISSVAAEDSGLQISTDVARAQSLDHFRQAIKSDPLAEDSRYAWRAAWRLVACIPPQELTFTCSDE